MTPGTPFKKCPRCQMNHPLDAQACPCGHTFRTQFTNPQQTQAFQVIPGAGPMQGGPQTPNNPYMSGQTQMFSTPQAQSGPQMPGAATGGPQAQQVICPMCHAVYPNYVEVCQCGYAFRPAFPQQMQSPYQNQGYVQQVYQQNFFGMGISQRLLITLILWFFGSSVGAHRFYLGHTRTAIMMAALTVMGLLTIFFLVGYVFFVAVSIWGIYDLVMIFNGSLRPIDGTPLF